MSLRTATDYLWFSTRTKREYLNITPQVEEDRPKKRRAGGYGIGVRDAHHRGRVRE